MGERKCSNCAHATQIGEREYQCEVEDFDLEALSCFEERKEKNDGSEKDI